MRQYGSRPGTSSNYGSSSYGTNHSFLNNNNTTRSTLGSRGGGGAGTTSNTTDGMMPSTRTTAPAFGSLAAAHHGGSGSGISSRPGSSGGVGGGGFGQRASSAGIGNRLPNSLSANRIGAANNTTNSTTTGSPLHRPGGGTSSTSSFQTTNSQIGAHAAGGGNAGGNSLLRSLRPGSSGSLNMPSVPHDPHHPAANGMFGNHHAGLATSPAGNSSSPSAGTGRVGANRFGSTIGAGGRFGAGAGGGAADRSNAPAFSCTVLSSETRSCVKPLSIYVGSGCTQGFRPTMEDEHINMIGAKTIDGNPMSLFAILDGHCGRRVAELGSQMLPEALFNHPQIGQNNAQAFVESIMQIDKQIHTALRNQDGGATLISALVHKRMLFVACLGDARAVLYDNGHAIPMSIDHKPSDPQEQARIVRCGGFVHFGRVSGCLAVSRALGDFEFKISMGRFVQKEFQVSNIADIRQINLTDTSRFLILACDGLWDVMGNQEAVDWVKDYLAKHDAMLNKNVTDTLNRASQAMAEAAVAKGSTDNVSVTIVLFHAPADMK